MILTPEQWLVAQSWIGTAEPLATFQERYERNEDSLDAAILESLNSQLSTLIAQPSSLSLPSGLSMSIGENIRGLQSLIKRFLDQGGLEGDFMLATGTRAYRRVRPDLR